MVRKKKISEEKLRERIYVFRGTFKREAGEKPFTERWAVHKREEIELEERKFKLLTRKRKN